MIRFARDHGRQLLAALAEAKKEHCCKVDALRSTFHKFQDVASGRTLYGVIPPASDSPYSSNNVPLLR